MLDVDAIVDADVKGLNPEAITTLAQRMLGRLREQQQHLQQRDERIAHQASEIERKDADCGSRPPSSRRSTSSWRG